MDLRRLLLAAKVGGHGINLAELTDAEIIHRLSTRGSGDVVARVGRR